MVADAFGELGDHGAQRGDLFGDPGQWCVLDVAVAVLVDDGAYVGMAVQGGAADPGG